MHTEIRSASVILKYQLKCCNNIHVKKSTLIFWNGSHSLFPPRIYQVPVFSCGLDTFKIYFSWRRGWLGIQDAKEINLLLDIFSFSIDCWGIWYPFIWNISNYFESIININLVLYRSESPTQAFLILAVWLYRRFKTQQDAGKPLAEIECAMQSTVLAYDNMCHVDSLKISKKNLPFPEPFDKAWHLVTKVIDRLHLRNHKNQKCKTLYNPDGKIPSEFNTMSCEQTFVWASRMKKIICAMTRLHQFFFIHRSVKRRNKYTELCHVRNKTPVLPKVPLFKAMLWL